AAWIAVEVEKERELNGLAVAASGAVPCAVPGVAARLVDVHRVITGPLRSRSGDHLAHFVQNRPGATSDVRGNGRGIDEVSTVGGPDADIPVGAVVLGVGYLVLGATDTRVELIETRDLVPDETGIGPARSPENHLHVRIGHDDAAVID